MCNPGMIKTFSIETLALLGSLIASAPLACDHLGFLNCAGANTYRSRKNPDVQSSFKYEPRSLCENVFTKCSSECFVPVWPTQPRITIMLHRSEYFPNPVVVFNVPGGFSNLQTECFPPIPAGNAQYQFLFYRF